MLLLLYGPDTYRSRQKLQEIIKHYQKVNLSGLNLRYYNGRKDDCEKFWDEIKLVPMFPEKRLVILKNVFSNPEFKEKILKYLKKNVRSDKNILFFEEEDILEKDSLFQFLKKNGKVQKFAFLEGAILKNWIKNEFAKYKTRVSITAVEKLINFVGSDSWQLANEIKKLASFAKNKEIQEKDIELLVKPRIETDIFKTIDAIAQKNKKQALSLIHQHLEKGDNPLYLLSMINFQFRNLLIVKSGAKLMAHPYVVMKTTRLAKFFSLEELKKIYRKIFEVDLGIKTGKIEPETGLDMFIAEI